ncbi:MAG: hypothetical protein HY537_11065 [Deltaproteobacteria bacterium]|nr:hypothetical protein [Deltaproteobacteria bacterium]
MARNKLQYLYSIGIFLGVIVTSYFMIDRESNARLPANSFQGTQWRADSQVADPALNQLLEMERALSRIRKDREDELKRKPPVSETPK